MFPVVGVVRGKLRGVRTSTVARALPVVLTFALALALFAGADASWRAAIEEATPAGAAGATTITRNLQATSTSDANFRDSFLESNATTTNNGSDVTMTVRSWSKGPCNSGNICHRSLIWFDLTDFATSSSVTAASVSLTATAAAANHTYDIHEVTASWTEAGVTWATRDGSTAWTGGGTFNATASQSLATGTTTGVKTFADIAALRTDVSTWINNSAVNYGWLVKDTDEGGTQAVWTFGTKENTTASNRPKLTMSFTAPWDSYTTSARTTISDNFSGTPKTVYMKGTGFSTSNQYKVAYYDAGGTKRFEEGPLTATGGTLNSAVTTTNYQTATAGTWRAVIQRSGATAFPATYSSVNHDTHEVLGEDTFTVQASALPSFPGPAAALVSALLAAAGYFLVRRRFAAPRPA